MAATRPPPRILYVHNGNANGDHFNYLVGAGLRVTEAHADNAVAEATASDPDIIVLDFDADGDVVAGLKEHPGTSHIPVIALVDMLGE